LKKILDYSFELLIGIPRVVKEFLQIKILKRHLKYKLLQKGVIGRKVVILAVFPGTTSVYSLNRMVQSILASSFTLLIVINENSGSSEVAEVLQKHNCTVLLRENIGRDIGAYQCGLNFLGIDQLAEKFERLALLNDSLYVTDHSGNFYQNFLDSEDWNCLYFNWQDIPHASSHSLILDKNALASKSMIDFWHRHYPSSRRLHSIFKGEFEITKSLGHDYFKPYVSYEMLSSSSFELNQSEKNQIKVWSKKSKSMENHLLSILLQDEQYSEVITYCVENFQISNSIGFFLYNKFQIPIKLDICKYEFVSKRSFIESLSANMSPEEFAALQQALNPSPLMSSNPLSYKLRKTMREIKEKRQ
jgi:hypothetical protein